MSTKNLASGFVVLLATVTSVANAQEQPGTNVTTPRPATVAPATATDATPTPAPLPAPATMPVTVVSDPNEPVIDATTTRSTYPNRPLLITGLVVLAGSYGAAAVRGATSDREDDKKLVYPVAGPWMDLANRDCSANACSNEDLNKALLIGDGILQGVGALGTLLSFVLPEKSTRKWYLIGQEGTHVTPMKMGYAGFGVGAYGRF